MPKIQAFLNKIKKYEKQRQLWMLLSVVFVSFILGIAVEWQQLVRLNIFEIWLAISSVLIITGICWWYWTMHVLKNILSERHGEIELLVDVSNDIRTIKEEVKKNYK